MASDQTFGDLYKANAILEADLDAAVDAYVSDPETTKHVRIGDAYAVDMVAAIKASPFASGMLADHAIKPGSKRSAVRTAILLSRPVKG